MFAINLEVRQADGRGAKYDVQSTAIAQCLPQALFAWALLLLAIQGFWITFADLPLPLSLATFLPVATMFVTVFVGIRKAVYPQQEVFKNPALALPTPIAL
jgi:ABC-type microcin C transport system permease subunit YejB